MPLRPGEPVGEAIHELYHFGTRKRPMKQIVAIAENNHRRGIAHRDAGGGLMSAPITQQPQQSFNPMQQSQVGQFAQLPTEKLTELANRYGNSPQGQIIGKVLQARRLGQAKDPTATTGAPQPPQGPMSPGGQTMQPMQSGIGPGTDVNPTSANIQSIGVPHKRGGIVRQRFAMGGNPEGISGSAASPWWERADERSMYLNGATPGRSDHLMATAPSGAYIVPADVIAGLGEGNSLAGAAVVDKMLHTGPWGTDTPRMGRGRGIPRAEAPREDDDSGDITAARAKGGKIKNVGEPVPVALSHGEYQISPEDVTRIGKGNIAMGHDVLDRWVLKMRAHHIKQLKHLKPPVGAKAA